MGIESRVEGSRVGIESAWAARGGFLRGMGEALLVPLLFVAVGLGAAELRATQAEVGVERGGAQEMTHPRSEGTG